MPGEYTCLNCGGTFDEPAEFFERHGFTSPPYERFTSCPHCGFEGYIKTIICAHCGEPIMGKYIELPNGDCYCDDCYIEDEVGEY